MFLVKACWSREHIGLMMSMDDEEGETESFKISVSQYWMATIDPICYWQRSDGSATAGSDDRTQVDRETVDFRVYN